MKRGFLSALFCALAVGALALALVLGAFWRPGQAQRLLFPSTTRNWILAERSNAEMVGAANQAVVTVIATKAVRQPNPSYSEALIPQQNSIPNAGDPSVQRGTGTGFIIDREGFIVTNDHVIRGADRIRVRLTDGRELRALVHGADAATDLALLKIEADQLNVLALGDSDEMRVGDPVIAIGNPLDYEHSVTAGIISAKGRKVYNNEPFEDFIQTDAAINRGNSGGPLLNQNGEVIGVNTVIRVDGSGISFAVPSNIVKRVIGQLRIHRAVSRGYLGLTPTDLTNDFREGLGLGNTPGILVADVVPDKPGARAGIEIYDVITQFDGRPLHNADEFYHLVANTAPPREVVLSVWRNGQPLQLKATLEERVREEASQSKAQPATLAKAEPSIGFSVVEILPDAAPATLSDKPAQELMSKVVVSELDPLGPAADSGLVKGQIVLEANRQPIRKLEDFNRVLATLHEGSVLILRVSAPQQRLVRLVAVRMGRD